MTKQAEPKKKLWRRIAVGLAKTFIGIFVLALLARSILSVVAAQKMRGAIDGIIAYGGPLSLDDLQAMMPEPIAKEDASRQYAAAQIFMDKYEYQYSHVVEYEGDLQSWPIIPPCPQFFTDTAEVLKKNKRFFDFVDEGADLPRCRMDCGVKLGIARALDEVYKHRESVFLLTLRTRYLAFQGKAGAAVDSLVSWLAFSRAFDYQPIIAAYLCQIATVTKACNDVITVIELTNPGEESLAELQVALERVDKPEMFAKSLRADLAVSVAMYRNLIAGAVDYPLIRENLPLVDMTTQAGFWGRPVLQYMAAGYIIDQTQAVQAAGLDWPANYHAVQALSPESYFGMLQDCSNKRIAVLAMQNLAYVRATAIAIMIERFRLAENRLPKSLDELIPAYTDSIPIDPCSGESLLYRVDDGFYKVYSTGEQLKYPGGDTSDRRAKRKWGVTVHFDNSSAANSE